MYSYGTQRAPKNSHQIANGGRICQSTKKSHLSRVFTKLDLGYQKSSRNSGATLTAGAGRFPRYGQGRCQLCAGLPGRAGRQTSNTQQPAAAPANNAPAKGGTPKLKNVGQKKRKDLRVEGDVVCPVRVATELAHEEHAQVRRAQNIMLGRV